MAALSSNTKIDPLILLRRAISGRTDIHLLSSENTKVFSLSEATTLALPTPTGRVSLPKTLTTRYRKPGTPSDASPLATPEHFYDSQSILCCYLNRDKGFAAYIQEAQQQGCAFVSATERKLITDFLEGKNAVEPASVVAFELGQAIYQGLGSGAAGSKAGATAGGAGGPVGESNGATASASAEGASPTKRARYAVDKTDRETVKRIMQLHEARQVTDRRTVLRGTKTVNFESTRTLVLDRIKASKDELRTRQTGGGANLVKPVGTPVSVSASSKRRPMNPIIIISPSSSSLITMHNVKRFLEDAVFEPPNNFRSSGPQIAAVEDVVVVSHRRGYTTSSAVSQSNSTVGNAAKPKSTIDRAARYFVVDGVEALGKFGEDAWDRVVCVMTTGQEWQFRPYKWSDPKELFHHVKGIFIQWTHDPPNPKVRAWNVTELRIDESKRHIDKSAAADFWRSLEAWIALHKPYVAY